MENGCVICIILVFYIQEQEVGKMRRSAAII